MVTTKPWQPPPGCRDNKASADVELEVAITRLWGPQSSGIHQPDCRHHQTSVAMESEVATVELWWPQPG